MAEIIDITGGFDGDDEYLGIDDMTLDELLDYLDELEAAREELDSREPRRMGEEYDVWADEHEELEDVIDEVCERIDYLKGRR